MDKKHITMTPTEKLKEGISLIEEGYKSFMPYPGDVDGQFLLAYGKQPIDTLKKLISNL